MEKQPSSTAARVERFALAALLVLVPLGFATGFSRYEVLKLALLTGLGTIGLLAFTIDFCRGRQQRLIGGGLASPIAWLFILLAAASLLWAPDTPESAAGLVRWVMLLGVFVLAASRNVGPGWIAVPLAISGAAAALLVLLTRFGVALPPPIPTGMAADAGAHGPFDHAVSAGAFLVVVGPVALYAAAIAVRRWRRAALLMAALVIYLALGLTGSAFTALGVASLLLGLVASFARLKGQASAMAIWGATVAAVVLVVVGRFGIGPAPVVEPEVRFDFLADNLYEELRIEGPENRVTTPEEWGFSWSQSLEIFDDAPMIGRGTGSYPYYAGFEVDAAHPYYLASHSEYHIHAAPPGLIAGLLVELGVMGLVLGVVFILLVCVSTAIGLSRPEPSQASGAGFLAAGAFTALLVLLGTPAAWHAGEGVAVFAVLGLATRIAEGGERGALLTPRLIGATSGQFQRVERWLLVGLPLVLMLAWGAWRVGVITATDFLRQRGELYLLVRDNEAAIEALQAAVELEPDDYRAHYYLGLAQYYTPTDEARRQAARDHLERAARLWPFDVRVQLRALKNQLARGGLDVIGRLEAAGSVRNQLLELRRHDPRNIEVLIQLADVHRALDDHDEAVAVLLEVTQLSEDASVLVSVYEEIGAIFADELNEPGRALEYYELALQSAPPRSTLAERLLQRIGFLQEWLRRGSRPADPTDRGGRDPGGPAPERSPAGDAREPSRHPIDSGAAVIPPAETEPPAESGAPPSPAEPGAP